MITGKPFDLEIVTPSGAVFDGKVDSVTVPGIDGTFQMLNNHAPIVSALGIGALKFTDAGGSNHVYATGGGFVQMLSNHASVVVESAEEHTTIDIERAVEAKKRAEERLTQREKFDAARAELSLARAINRLKIANK
jgi:F-type H+-transporting ATPase subunit epsilon